MFDISVMYCMRRLFHKYFAAKLNGGFTVINVFLFVNFVIQTIYCIRICDSVLDKIIKIYLLS